jgi:hypothetical protein
MKQILNVLENFPEENRVTVPEKYVLHIRTILERMNKMRGQGPAMPVEVHH